MSNTLSYHKHNTLSQCIQISTDGTTKSSTKLWSVRPEANEKLCGVNSYKNALSLSEDLTDKGPSTVWSTGLMQSVRFILVPDSAIRD